MRGKAHPHPNSQWVPPALEDHSNIPVKVTQTEIDFLFAEAETGLTFARLAAAPDWSDETAAGRHQVNARKAYDTLTHYMGRVAIDSADLRDLKAKLAELG